MLFEYDGYELTKNWYDMTFDEQTVISACSWMVKNETTIRVTATLYIYSCTTFWRRIHFVCSELSPDLYEAVKNQMRINMERTGFPYDK